jgi:hypothetical protein
VSAETSGDEGRLQSSVRRHFATLAHRRPLAPNAAYDSDKMRVPGLVLAGALIFGMSVSEGAVDRRWSTAPRASQSYADTCRLVSSWCQVTPTPGGIPDTLRRPLHLPTVSPAEPCPATSGQPFSNDQFGGIAIGEGPVQPVVGGTPVASAERGVIAFHRGYRPYRKRWHSLKTLWFSQPSYQGPVFIRGRQLDGPHQTVFGEAPRLLDPQLGPGPTSNGTGGWREWPGATWLRHPGCYAWQIDGTDFSNVTVFKAVFAKR